MQQLYDDGFKNMNPTEERRYSRHEYLYMSVVFRFLSLVGIARKFEAEAFYIDSRIAKGKELDFLRYAKGFLWVMTFSDLTPRDGMPGRDHFLNDEFRPLLDMCYRRVEKVLPENEPKAGEIVFDWRRFRALIDKSNPTREDLDLDSESLDEDTVRAINQVLRFFDGISPAEYEISKKSGNDPHKEYKRRRWDRIVCLHLLVICFIGTFGYSWQKKEIRKKRREAIDRLIAEAMLPGLYRDGEPRPQADDFEPVVKNFQKNLKMIGMEINEYNKYMIHLPRMEGRKQIRELGRDLHNAISEFTLWPLWDRQGGGNRSKDDRELDRGDVLMWEIENGLARYLPCSHRNDPRLDIGIGQEAIGIGQEAGKTALYDLAEPKTFDEMGPLRESQTPSGRTAEVRYCAPQIWASLFWALRTTLGQDEADMLLVRAWSSTEQGDQFDRRFVDQLLNLASDDQRKDIENVLARHGYKT